MSDASTVRLCYSSVVHCTLIARWVQRSRSSPIFIRIVVLIELNSESERVHALRWASRRYRTPSRPTTIGGGVRTMFHATGGNRRPRISTMPGRNDMPDLRRPGSVSRR